MDNKKIFFVSGEYDKFLNLYSDKQSSLFLLSPLPKLDNLPTFEATHSSISQVSEKIGSIIQTINIDLPRILLLNQKAITYERGVLEEEKHIVSLNELKTDELKNERIVIEDHLLDALKERYCIGEYVQGDITGASYCSVIVMNAFLKIFELDEERQHDDRSFMYLDDDHKVCGFSIAYSPTNDKYWMMGITRNSASDNANKLVYYWFSESLHSALKVKEYKEKLINSSNLNHQCVSAKDMKYQVKEIVQSDECYSVYEGLLNSADELQINFVTKAIDKLNDTFLYGKSVLKKKLSATEFDSIDERNSDYSARFRFLSERNKAAEALMYKNRLFFSADICFGIIYIFSLSEHLSYEALKDSIHFKRMKFYSPLVMTTFMCLILICLAVKSQKGVSKKIPKLFYLGLLCIGVSSIAYSLAMTPYYITVDVMPTVLLIGLLLLSFIRQKTHSLQPNKRTVVSFGTVLFLIQIVGAIALCLEAGSVKYFETSSLLMIVTLSVMTFCAALLIFKDARKVIQHCYKQFKNGGCQSFNVEDSKVISFSSTSNEPQPKSIYSILK